MNLLIIFFTGLTVGGLTCAAVQGGLLASSITNQKGVSKLWPTLAFVVAKFVAYTLLGFLLGTFGSSIQLSDNFRTGMQIAAGLYMIAVALDLLKVHPIFRYTVIQPPRFMYRLLKSESKSHDLFAPLFLGLLTIFIPCGTTLAMESLAIVSGSGLLGAAIMAAFILGTTPVFLSIGLVTSRLDGWLLKITAWVIIYLGITSINGALVFAGSPLTLQTLAENSPIQFDFSGEASPPQSTDQLKNVKIENGVQVADITVLPNGYSPNYIQVKQNQPVRMNLNSQGGLGCTSVFRIASLGISKQVPLGGSTYVEFTPQAPGKIAWSCSMGMYRGVIEVI